MYCSESTCHIKAGLLGRSDNGWKYEAKGGGSVRTRLQAVRLEVQLRDGKLITGALPTYEAITTYLEPVSPVTFPPGSCQAFPDARHV